MKQRQPIVFMTTLPAKVKLLIPTKDEIDDTVIIEVDRSLLEKFSDDSPLGVIGGFESEIIDLNHWPEPNPGVMKHILEIADGELKTQLDVPFEILMKAYDYFDVPRHILPVGIQARYLAAELHERQSGLFRLMLQEMTNELGKWGTLSGSSIFKTFTVISVEGYNGYLPWFWQMPYESNSTYLGIKQFGDTFAGINCIFWNDSFKERFTCLAREHALDVSRFEVLDDESTRFGMVVTICMPDRCRIIRTSKHVKLLSSEEQNAVYRSLCTETGSDYQQNDWH